MKSAEEYRRYLCRLVWLLFALLCARVVAAPGEMTMGGESEQTFRVLQTKTGAYTNVTVTKKTKDWIFILHSAGVCNLKVSDLSTDARIALGYEKPPEEEKAEDAKQAAQAAPLAELARLNLKNIKFDAMKRFAADWKNNRKEKIAEAKTFIASNPETIAIVLGIVGSVYIFVSVCFWSICRKTHIAPGPLVWVPFLQLIPLLRAANMPRVWFFVYFVPVLNIIAVIMLSINIVKTRGKSPWVAFLLILPPTSLFAFLYLALSRSAPVEMVTNEVLALETA
jgi:hypothetical protein